MKPPIYSDHYNQWVVEVDKFEREQWDWCSDNLHNNVIRSGRCAFWFDSGDDADLFYLRWK